MALVVCEQVGKGLRSSERTVLIRDIHGRKEYLRVEADFLTIQGNRALLPVAKVFEDKDRAIALIELPQESESGTNRLWMRAGDLIPDRAKEPV
jgi:hypothetical protein